MWVLDDDDQRQTLIGPTWVVWFPGERIEYGALGETVHWLVANRTGRLPGGAPRPGSRVRLQRGPEPGQPVDEALVIEYLDDSPDQAGPLAMVARADEYGVGVYDLGALVEVLDESDEDLHNWTWGPGVDSPMRLTRPPR